MTGEQSVSSDKKRVSRNWWKVAFFVSLVVFEVTREYAVVASSTAAQPNTMANLFSYNGYVRAQGTWKRIDGGDRLVSSTVTIECHRDTGRCLEASTHMNDEYVYSPELDWFDAKFETDSVSYENDMPDCANYSVRLDLKMKKVFAVRQRKANPTNPACLNLENRIEMQLSDGFENRSDTLDDHFLPILKTIISLN